MHDSYLTTAQAAALLGLSPRGVRNAVQRGRLPGVKPGRRAIMIHCKDIETYKATPQAKGGRPRKVNESRTIVPSAP